MDLLEFGAQQLSQKLGLQVDADTLQSSLSSLLGGAKGDIDFAGLASKMAANGDFANILESWLGDGGNQAISADSIQKLLGSDEVANFANQVGTRPEAAASGLSEVLPQIMDKASSGGELLASVGGVAGLMDAAKSFLR